MTRARSTSWKTILGHLCALVVAGVFLYAAYEKIQYPRQFAISIKNYQMVPESALNAMALLLPWWEVVAAIAIIIPASRRAGATVITALLLMFMIAVSYAAFYKGLNINCGCFGKDNPAAAGWKTIGLDAGLLLLTFASVYFQRASRRDAAARPVHGAGSVASPQTA